MERKSTTSLSGWATGGEGQAGNTGGPGQGAVNPGTIGTDRIASWVLCLTVNYVQTLV